MDAASCPVGMVVYILTNKEIITCNVGNEEYGRIKLSGGDDLGYTCTPTGLSVNNKCNLLVTCGPEQTILIINISTRLITRLVNLSLHYPLISARHAIQLSPGRIAVSFGRSDDVGSRQAVLIYDVYRSKIEWISPDSWGLNGPRHLAALGDGRLIIADNGNSRVLLVDPSDVSVPPIVLYRSRFYETSSMFYNPISCQLYVSYQPTKESFLYYFWLLLPSGWSTISITDIQYYCKQYDKV